MIKMYKNDDEEEEEEEDVITQLLSMYVLILYRIGGRDVER